MENIKDNIIKFSIVVPVYNGELYLEKCLESLINQTYKNIEIICINDGSTDGSGEILKKYETYGKIKVFYQKNKGLSEVRNRGVRLATGDYLAFVDCDDWIDLDTCENVAGYLRKSYYDVIMFPYVREYGDKSFKKIIYKESIVQFNKSDCKRLQRQLCGPINEELKNPKNSVTLCTVNMKFYLLDIMKKENIKFVDTKIIGSYEDGLYNIELFEYITNALYINTPFYHYRRDVGNSLTHKHNPNLNQQRKKLYSIIRAYIDKNNLDSTYKTAIDNKILLGIIGLGFNVLSKECTRNEKKILIKKILEDEEYTMAGKNFDLHYLPIHWKIFFFLCKEKKYLPVYYMLSLMDYLRQKI